MHAILPPARQAISPAAHYATKGPLGFLARNRYQLLGAVIVAVVLPALLRSEFAFLDASLDAATATTLGTGIAVLGGAYVLRRITIYHGAQALAYVFPVFFAAFMLVVLVFFFSRIDYARGQYLMSFVLAVGWFLFATRIERRVRRPGFLLLPFGNTENLLAWPGADWRIARSPDEQPTGISGVVADLRSDLDPKWQQMLARSALRGVPVYHSKQLAEFLTGQVEIEHLSENNLGSLIPSSLYTKAKRLADLAFALLVLPLAFVVCAPIALAILILDGRPIFFRQERIGFRGEVFVVLKFRTMRLAQEQHGRHFTIDGDPRVTPLGRLLRRCRLDELPQILNILRGEMSWIGPRPESLPLAQWYESKIPFYSYRHIVRPGISGWAAVHQGNVAEIDAASRKLQYDFYYIKHFSLWLDMLIFAKTLRVMLTGFGSR